MKTVKIVLSLFVLCLFLLHTSFAFAQDEIAEIKARVDSLKDVQDHLTLELEKVEEELTQPERTEYVTSEQAYPAAPRYTQNRKE